MPLLALRAVGRRYDASRRDALNGVDLTVPQGVFVAIEGPSGGGKSTLLNIIGLLDKPDCGSYLIDGVESVRLNVRRAARLRSDTFAFIFQSFHLLDRRPLVDSVELGLLYRGVPARERRARAMQALAEVGLQAHSEQSAATLSGGEQQRVAIARALATGAPVIVADEPTGNLDAQNSQRVVELLSACHATGRTVVLVTHSEDVAAAAQVRVRLHDGSLLNHNEQQKGHSPTRVVRPDVTPPGRASRLRALDLVADAVASVGSRRGRTGGLILAVAVGVALAVGTIGISASAGSQVRETFDAHANRYVTASWGEGELSPAAASTDGLSKRLRGLAGVEKAGLLVDHGGARVRATRVRDELQVSAYTASLTALTAAEVGISWSSGRPHRLVQGEILVGRNLARQLMLASVDDGPTVEVGGTDYTVAGLIEESPRVPTLTGSIVLLEGESGALEPESAQYSALLVTRPGAAGQVAGQVALVIDPYTPEAVRVEAPVDPSTLRGDIEVDVQNALWAFTALALLGSVAGLANAMVLSVLERRQEFGLRRAVGARPVHIAGLVMVESVLIGALGGLVGLGLGLGALLANTIARHWIPVFDLSVAPIAVAGGILVGVVGGLLAATRASTIQPHEALRQ